MKALEAAIITRFQSQLATVKGPFVDDVPSKLPSSGGEMTFPFCAIQFPPGNVPKDFFDATTLMPQTVRFTLYDDDLSDVETLQDALHAAFNGYRMSLSSGVHCRTLRMDQFAGFAGVHKDNARIFRATSVYRFDVYTG